MSKPTLYILVGLSGSGKSTYAKQIAEITKNTVVISTDAIREELTGDYRNQEHNEEVFNLFHDRIRKNLENKKNVVADATNLTIKSRRAIMMKVNGLDIKKMCFILPKPFEKCKEDNLHREHFVPDKVLEKQIRRFQTPFCEEGFDEIKIYHCYEWENNKVQPLKLFDSTLNFNQKNPHHIDTLYIHCLNVCNMFCSNKPISTLLRKEYVDAYIMGARLHDIGKVNTQTFDENGIAHYFGHAELGAYKVLSEMKTPLSWTDDDLLNCCFLINYHMLPFNWQTRKVKEKWKKIFREYKYNILLDFHECDKAR